MAVNNAAPAPVSAPAAAPLAAPAQEFSGPSVDEIFSAFESKLIPDPTSDMSKVKSTRELNYDDFLNLDDKEPAEEVIGAEDEAAPETDESIDAALADGEQAVAPEEKPESDIDYSFEEEIGGNPVKIQIKSAEQLNNIIRKAHVADKIWRDNQRYKNETIPQLESRATYADQIDKLSQENPFGLAETLIEDLPEAEVKEWILKMADEIGKNPEQKALDKRLRAAEIMERKLAEIDARDTQLKEKAKEAQRQADTHTVKSWSQSVHTRLQNKVPPQYHNLIEREIKNSITEAGIIQRQTPGTQVTVQMMEKIFAKNFKPIFELITSGGSKVNVKQEVGKALEQKKAQNMSRIQTAANSARSQPQRKSRMQEYIDGHDVVGALDYIEQQMHSGNLRMRGN